MISVRYDQAGELSAESEETLLEVARKSSYPLIHECGGFARCSTCRIRVLKGAENLTPRTPEEQSMANRRGWEPNIRLACQARVLGPVEVKRELNRRYDLQEFNLNELTELEKPRSQLVVVLFSDIRGFTTMSEKLEAFDIVYLLNQYYSQIGEAILLNHGHVLNYMGDGIMAVFGLQGDSGEKPVLRALRAAWVMQRVAEALNDTLGQDLGVEIRCGIGLHAGECILGKVGHPGSHRHTAIGDTVNTASRIESETKECGVQTLISEAILERGGKQVETGLKTSASLKGKQGELTLHEFTGLLDDGPGLLQAIWLRARVYGEPCLQELRDALLKEFPDQYFPDANVWPTWLEEQADKLFLRAPGSASLEDLLARFSRNIQRPVLQAGLLYLARQARMAEYVSD